MLLDRTEIPFSMLEEACLAVCKVAGNIPFKIRGIMITRDLIKATMELLNEEVDKTLPQNCRNDIEERTPHGLDKRIKIALNSNLRTANIISDVLEQASIVSIVGVLNPKTSRYIKGTKLNDRWCW